MEPSSAETAFSSAITRKIFSVAALGDIRSMRSCRGRDRRVINLSRHVKTDIFCFFRRADNDAVLTTHNPSRKHRLASGFIRGVGSAAPYVTAAVIYHPAR
jgi:hypothetical protein